METRRTGVVSGGGTPVTLLGHELERGTTAPDWHLVRADEVGAIHTVTLADTAGVRLFSVVPSVDTNVCALQAKRFDAEVQQLGDAIALYTVSIDSPYRLAGFNAECGLSCSIGLSDYRPERSFGRAWGLLVEEDMELCRACIVLDPDGTVAFVEIAPDTWDHIDYDRVLAALQEAVVRAS